MPGLKRPHTPARLMLGGFFAAPSGGGPLTLPTPSFTSTGLLLWYDPSYSGWVGQDTNLSTTTAALLEDLTGNNYTGFQPVKQRQPLYVSSDRVNFTGVAPFDQHMDLFLRSGLIKNTTKVYFGAVVRLSSTGVTASGRTIFQISKSAGTTTNRFSIDITGAANGRAPRLKMAVDNGSPEGTEVTKTMTGKVTADTWAYIDCYVDLTDTNGTAYWSINGTTNETFNNCFADSARTFYNGDPLVATFGNTNAGGAPFIGDLRAVILQTGGLTGGYGGAQHTSIRSYLASRRDAA